MRSTTGRIWLIGGTHESAWLAAAIAQAHLPCTVSVTTEAAKCLYAEVPELQVWIGQLPAHQLGQFLQAQGIVAILDASHPYAVEISNSAITIAAQLQIPYLRFERPALETNPSSTSSSTITLDSHHPLGWVLLAGTASSSNSWLQATVTICLLANSSHTVCQDFALHGCPRSSTCSRILARASICHTTPCASSDGKSPLAALADFFSSHQGIWQAGGRGH